MRAKKAAASTGILIGVAAVIYLISSKPSTPSLAPKSTGKKYTKAEFINLILPYAKAVGKKIGVPYQFIVAQISLETRFGNSSLFQKYFNVGGVKAVKGQKFISLPTVEYVKGVKINVNQNFAVYDNLAAGIVGYAGILQNKYFKKYLNKTTNPKTYVSLLQSGKPKYATDINYVPKMHKLIDAIAV